MDINPQKPSPFDDWRLSTSDFSGGGGDNHSSKIFGAAPGGAVRSGGECFDSVPLGTPLTRNPTFRVGFGERRAPARRVEVEIAAAIGAERGLARAGLYKGWKEGRVLPLTGTALNFV